MISIKTKKGFEIELPNEFNGYRFIEFISNGAFSVVVKVRDINDENYYAAKVISMTDMENKNLVKTISNEINILRTIEHPNIIKIYETFFIQSKNNDNIFVIITDYCSNGDLVQYISNHGFKNEEEKREIEYGILIGIEYLHEQGIAHCDIKPDNILLDENMNPIICDFGLSKSIYSENNGIINGALQYSSPELFENTSVDYFKADTWAIGITFYIISELKLPYIGGTTIKTGKLSIDSQDDSLNKFVEKCTKINPSERPAISDLLDDEYFSTINEDDIIFECTFGEFNAEYEEEKNDDEYNFEHRQSIDLDEDDFNQAPEIFDEDSIGIKEEMILSMINKKQSNKKKNYKKMKKIIISTLY